jgi:hypothetical protein
MSPVEETMNKVEAIQSLQASDLPTPEKRRLIRLIEDKGWNKESQEEILSTIRRASAAAKSALGSMTRKIDAYEARVASEEKQLADEAGAQIDQAATDFKAEMAKLRKAAEQLGTDGGFKAEAAKLAREVDELAARAKKTPPSANDRDNTAC